MATRGYDPEKGREYFLVALTETGNLAKHDGKYKWTKVQYGRFNLYCQNVQAQYTAAKTRDELAKARDLTNRLPSPERQWFRDMIDGKALRLGFGKSKDYEEVLELTQECTRCHKMYAPVHKQEEGKSLCVPCIQENIRIDNAGY